MQIRQLKMPFQSETKKLIKARQEASSVWCLALQPLSGLRARTGRVRGGRWSLGTEARPCSAQRPSHGNRGGDPVRAGGPGVPAAGREAQVCVPV